jgi:hypothetical protein
MCTVSGKVSHVCPVFTIRLEYPDYSLLFLIACICSLYLDLNVLPVWPMYFSGQSMHFIWQMALLLCEWGFNVRYSVLCFMCEILFLWWWQ